MRLLVESLMLLKRRGARKHVVYCAGYERSVKYRPCARFLQAVLLRAELYSWYPVAIATIAPKEELDEDYGAGRVVAGHARRAAGVAVPTRHMQICATFR